MDPGAPIRLTAQDLASPLWQKLQAYYTQELHRLRVKNDGVLGEQERGKVIGQIAQMKAFLDLANVPEP